MFHNNLKKLREEKGLTQYDLAYKLAISPNAVYRMERGTMTISVPTALAISEILGCTLDELLRA